MKKFIFLIVILSCIQLNVKAQSVEDSLKEQISEMKDRVNGMDERLMTSESDLSKLTKIKFSGYIQSEFNRYENRATLPSNNFSLRRVRLKATYEAADGVKFVVQPDFSPGSFSLKDAYVVLNDHFIQKGIFKNALSLTAGKFNRLNYEVEYSSSQREVPERSAVIRAIYPGERAIGFKLEVNPQNIPLKVQLGMFNGNDGGFNQASDTSGKSTANTIENKDYDNFKDIMARATYSFKLGSFGGLDIGAHAYFGSLKSNTNATLHSDFATIDSSKVGDAVKRNWFGAEFQFFADVLGGMSIKGEYIAGKNAILGGSKFANGNLLPNFQNNFAGYYVYLIKNIGKKNQFAFRYDYYDPNTDIKGSDVTITKYAGSNSRKIGIFKSSIADLAYTTFTFAWHYYFDDNIRVTLAYAIVQNEKVGLNTAGVSNYKGTYTNPDGSVGSNDYSKVFNQNQLTIRLQAKF
ncbi:MAG: porin [Bacteroidales bacterium]